MKNPSFKRLFLIPVLCALSALEPVSRPASAASALIDATGKSVVLTSAPKRIVTLAPSLGELAADLLGEDVRRIVGVSEYTDFPAALERVKQVGSYARFNVEQVVALKPDLVLATTDGNPKDQVLRLRELGLNVVVVATGNFGQVEESIRLVARALGAHQQGERMVAQFRAQLARIRERAKSRPRSKVFLQVGEAPLITVGKGAFLHDALDAVGASNVYEDLSTSYPKPTLEDVVSRDPDTIIVMALGRELGPFEAMAKSWSRFPKMKAVQGSRVKVLKADALLRPSLRLLEGLSALEKAVHGEK